MKILFICRENRGRSQIAMGFYRQLHPDDAASAGTMVDTPGQELGELTPPSKTVALMNELGIDTSDHIRTQLTQEALAYYDKIIVMAEPEHTPDWCHENPKTELWNVEDTKGKSMSEARIIRDEIKVRVVDPDRRLQAAS